jgi:nicotinamidase-related amidase
MNAPHLYERLTRENAALLLVDHQVGLYTGVRDIDTLNLTHNVVGLTKAALALKLPVIVTTTTENMPGTRNVSSTRSKRLIARS